MKQNTSPITKNPKEVTMNTQLLRNQVLLVLAVLLLWIAAAANTGTVTKVKSGGVVLFGGFEARLTGLIVPGAYESDLGYKIYDFAKRELEGRVVKLFTWTRDNTAAGIVYDDEGRAFVQILCGKDMDISFNELMLKKGYARVDPEYLPDDLRHYLDLEKEAREKDLGIWADR
jgi:hypothetical protein